LSIPSRKLNKRLQCVRKDWVKSDPFIALRLAKEDIIRVASAKVELIEYLIKPTITQVFQKIIY